MSITAERERKPDERMTALKEAAKAVYEKAVYDKQIISGMNLLKLAQSLGPENGFNKSDVERTGVDVLAGMLAEGKYEEVKGALKYLNLPSEVLRRAEFEALERCLASKESTRRAEYLIDLLDLTSAGLAHVQLGALRRIIQKAENNKSYHDAYYDDDLIQALQLVNHISEYKDQLSAAEMNEYSQHAIKIYTEGLRREIRSFFYMDPTTKTLIKTLKERLGSWGIDSNGIALANKELYTWAFDHPIELRETAYSLLESLGVPKSYVAAEGKKAVDRLLSYVRDNHNYLYTKDLYNVITLSGLGPEAMKDVGMKLHGRALELHKTEADIEICTLFGLDNNIIAESIMNHYSRLLKKDPLGALRFAKDHNMELDKKHKAAVETYRWLEYIKYHIISPPNYYFDSSGFEWVMKELEGDFGPTAAEMEEIKRSILPKLRPGSAVGLANEIGDEKLIDEQMRAYYEELAESGTLYSIHEALFDAKRNLARDTNAYKKFLEIGISRALNSLVWFEYGSNNAVGPLQEAKDLLKDLLSEAELAGIACEAKAIAQKAFLSAVSRGQFTTAYWIAVVMDYPDDLVKLSGKLKDIVGEMPLDKNLNLLRASATDSEKAS